jgi:hypothetical protein
MVKTNTQLRLSTGETITLNDQQDEALYAMQKWLSNPDDLFFCLSGYAGTGKTTIVVETISFFMKHLYNPRMEGLWPHQRIIKEDRNPVSVSAPTNKAKNQIQMTTGLEGKTVQSLLGLSPNINLENFNINKPEFGQLRKPTLGEHKLVVIDEASMFNADLFKMTVETANKLGTKILFMCDEAQLPPVNEVLSPVIDSELITSRYQLTKVERQKDSNPLMGIYDLIRDNLSSSVDAFSRVSNVNDQGEGIEFIKELMTFGNKVVREFASKASHDDALNCKILCWTNDRVAFWNKAVRAALYNDKVLKTLDLSLEDKEMWRVVMPGDMLMGYTPSEAVVVSTEYLVDTVKHENKMIRYGSSRALSVDVAVLTVQIINVQTKQPSTMHVICHEQENLVKFHTAFSFFLDQAKFNRKWKDYYDFKDQYHLLQDINDGNGKLILRKDIDYSYALTIHKSQGSTYNKVFIDMPDVDKNPRSLEKNKLKYVAMSRPRQLACILTN